MKKAFLLFQTTLILYVFSGCDVAQSILSQSGGVPNVGLSNDDVIRGLKNALSVGTDTSVNILGKLNGYYKDALIKLALPPEAQGIAKNIAKIPGGQKLIDDAILAINRAAEDAAPQAKQIFVNAITGMSIADGFAILKGNNTAATDFLKSKTMQDLTNAFSPRVKNSLGKPIVMGFSAESAYKKLIDSYNTASLNGLLWQPVKQNSLSEYTTQKALDGLFLKVAEEEKKIRKDPLHQVTDILRKVFGSK